ncbi:MAG: hypothetical protein HOH42_16090, partial [Ilumatobacter sp.]|uniref:hypothetical protein n=1 Tax=Ilumatobacter sp. TaxID=1967498 RepID=UPI00374FEC4D|nr:hypothetical protein [Ilumatobacter sp.]
MSDEEPISPTVGHRLKGIARRERHALDTDFIEPPDRPIREDIRDPRFLRAVVAGLTIFLVSRLCVIAGAGVRAA